MTKKPGARRPKGRKSDAPDDVFIAKTLALVAWAKQNSRALTVGAVVLVIAILAGLYYRNFQEGKRRAAANQLVQVRQALSSGNASLARRDLESLVSQFDGTPAATEGRILLARSYLTNGQPDQAIPIVRPLAQDLDDPLGVPAASLLADAYEAAGDAERAEAVHLRVADRARFRFQRRAALADAGRLRMERGDAVGAAELFARVVEMTPQENPDRGIYELRLAEARATAASGAPADAPAAAQEPG